MLCSYINYYYCNLHWPLNLMIIIIIVVTIHATHSVHTLSDGYAYYEEWQSLVEKSDKQVQELLESYGTKCKSLKVTFG